MSVKYQDYYSILDVARSASQEEIQRAYRKLARQYHPDVNKEADAGDKFKKIAEAYEVLKDPEKRKLYDSLGENWKSGQEFRPPPGWSGAGARGSGGGRRVEVDFEDFAGMGGGGFSDFFESVFGNFGANFGGQAQPRGRARARQPTPRQGQSQRVEITVSLSDVHHGATRRLSLSAAPAFDDQTGEPHASVRTLDVRIPPGTTDGSVIRLKGQGSPGMAGGPPGDLLVSVCIAPDARFQVHGHDLVHVAETPLTTAVLGGKIEVPTMDGPVVVTVPAGAQPGSKLRLRGKGLPRRGGGAGDLLVELRVVVPKTLTDEQRELYQRLAAVPNRNHAEA